MYPRKYVPMHTKRHGPEILFAALFINSQRLGIMQMPISRRMHRYILVYSLSGKLDSSKNLMHNYSYQNGLSPSITILHEKVSHEDYIRQNTLLVRL